MTKKPFVLIGSAVLLYGMFALLCIAIAIPEQAFRKGIMPQLGKVLGVVWRLVEQNYQNVTIIGVVFFVIFIALGFLYLRQLSRS